MLAPSITVVPLSIVFSHWLGECPSLLYKNSDFYLMLYVFCPDDFDRDHKCWVIKSSIEWDIGDMVAFFWKLFLELLIYFIKANVDKKIDKV